MGVEQRRSTCYPTQKIVGHSHVSKKNKTSQRNAAGARESGASSKSEKRLGIISICMKSCSQRMARCRKKKKFAGRQRSHRDQARPASIPRTSEQALRVTEEVEAKTTKRRRRKEENMGGEGIRTTLEAGTTRYSNAAEAAF